MEFLIRAALILDSNSPYHLKKKDILIKNGVIKKIDDNIKFGGQVIEQSGLRVTNGLLDLRSNFNDPGFEHKEDLESGSNAAAAGGFTDVVIMPNNQPITASKNAISYFQKWNRDSAVKLHPTAAVSVNCEGKELTEMIDLHTAGAVAFTDGANPIWHTNILLKSLLYVQKFGGLIINRPEDQMLTAFGNMNEGVESTSLGMKGMPFIAEEVMIKRDLQLLEYAGGKIHFSMISSVGSVALIKEAKKKGLNVTADVGIHYLLFDESYLSTFDTNYKVNPPFRTEKDKKALIKAVRDGVIDAVVSDHQPHDEECKKLEFDLADFGITGLQSYYSQMLKVFGDETDAIIEKTQINANSILGFNQKTIEEGAEACLTLYSPDIDWVFNAAANRSKSENSPLYGKELKGGVIGIFNDNKLVLN
jgi:dihydroorotase